MNQAATDLNGILTPEQCAAILAAVTGIADAHIVLTRRQVAAIVALSRATPK